MQQDGRNHHEHEKIVELTRVPYQFEADTLVAKLKANDIDASVSGDDVGGMRPALGLVDGYRVLVFENDLDRARQLVAEE